MRETASRIGVNKKWPRWKSQCSIHKQGQLDEISAVLFGFHFSTARAKKPIISLMSLNIICYLSEFIMIKTFRTVNKVSNLLVKFQCKGHQV